MLETPLGFSGGVTAPHHAASLSGRDVIVDGGTAIEAMVAMAATIAVAYPAMNGLGGDAFWLIQRPGKAPVAIAGAGRAAGLATPPWYAERGHTGIPFRGPDAALVVPGAVATWQMALGLLDGERRPLGELLANAVRLAKDGVPMPRLMADLTAAKLDGLATVPGFADVYLKSGRPPAAGERLRLPALAGTLERIGEAGCDDFYRGEIASTHGRYLEAVGSPLRQSDFAAYHAETVTPLSVKLSTGTVYNLPPPTQGFATLMILGLFDRLGAAGAETFEHIHHAVEATKRAYALRNRELGDPDSMRAFASDWLAEDYLDEVARDIDRDTASPWPAPSVAGDTIWMGAADRQGNVVSFIQSLFWEYGSGVTCPDTGVTFENRGAGFSLQPGPNQLAPGKRPLHTLNPGLAVLNDGRVMSFGTMGGEGQPQSMSATYMRYAHFGGGLQRAIASPRWLLGRTWGDDASSLKLEGRFDGRLVERLRQAGHAVSIVGDFDQVMGHAGAVVRHPNGLIEAATDPRSDGAALAF